MQLMLAKVEDSCLQVIAKKVLNES